jgi:phosphotransacetylase
MRAEIAASSDPEVRRAAAMMQQQKAERDMALGSRSDVAKDPEARIAQLEAMRQHNSLLFEARHADEYKALIEARNSGPPEVRRLDATASRQ